jgi:hypothetical protein
MAERDVDKARREAKLRVRSGRAPSYMRALNQLATENGYGNWAEYSKVLAAKAPQLPDIRVRLVTAGGRERFVGVELAKVLDFHELDEDQWNHFAHQDRLQLVFEFALSTRHERGDTDRYTPELVESNVPSLTVLTERHGEQVVKTGADVTSPDFLVTVENTTSGTREVVGVQLADLLELHGLNLVDWEASSPEEKEALVEESALWAKRSTGDLSSYFTRSYLALMKARGKEARRVDSGAGPVVESRLQKGLRYLAGL